MLAFLYISQKAGLILEPKESKLAARALVSLKSRAVSSGALNQELLCLQNTLSGGMVPCCSSPRGLTPVGSTSHSPQHPAP